MPTQGPALMAALAPMCRVSIASRATLISSCSRHDTRIDDGRAAARRNGSTVKHGKLVAVAASMLAISYLQLAAAWQQQTTAHVMTIIVEGCQWAPLQASAGTPCRLLLLLLLLLLQSLGSLLQQPPGSFWPGRHRRCGGFDSLRRRRQRRARHRRGRPLHLRGLQLDFPHISYFHCDQRT